MGICPASLLDKINVPREAGRERALSFEQPDTHKIRFGPFALILDDALQRFSPKCIAHAVGSHGDAAAVLMCVPLVGTDLADEIKAVPGEGGYEFTRGDRTEAGIVDGHEIRR